MSQSDPTVTINMINLYSMLNNLRVL